MSAAREIDGIQPLQFHFATILSPWIRRALIAGGFGNGTTSSRAPSEIAPVVSYHGGRSHHSDHAKSADIEAIQEVPKEESAPIIPEDTPLFHIDLPAAVRAAESGIGFNRTESQTSSYTKTVEGKTAEA